MSITHDTHACEMFSIIKDITYTVFEICYQLPYQISVIEDDTLDT